MEKLNLHGTQSLQITIFTSLRGVGQAHHTYSPACNINKNYQNILHQGLDFKTIISHQHPKIFVKLNFFSSNFEMMKLKKTSTS
jgi:hypothetical protein